MSTNTERAKRAELIAAASSENFPGGICIEGFLKECTQRQLRFIEVMIKEERQNKRIFKSQNTEDRHVAKPAQKGTENQ